MEKTNAIGSGVEYPTLEIGGMKYTVKFSRALLYRMGKAGVVFAPTILNAGQPTAAVTMPWTMLVDVLHIAIGFQGTHEDLAELVYDTRAQAVDALMVAWGKAFPLPQPTLQETPETREQVQ